MRKLNVRFWYESNSFFGWIETLNDLEKALECQLGDSGGLRDLDHFLDISKDICTEHINPNVLNFGTRMEHDGEKTLRMHLKEIGLLDEFIKRVKRKA